MTVSTLVSHSTHPTPLTDTAATRPTSVWAACCRLPRRRRPPPHALARQPRAHPPRPRRPGGRGRHGRGGWPLGEFVGERRRKEREESEKNDGRCDGSPVLDPPSRPFSLATPPSLLITKEWKTMKQSKTQQHHFSLLTRPRAATAPPPAARAPRPCAPSSTRRTGRHRCGRRSTRTRRRPRARCRPRARPGCAGWRRCLGEGFGFGKEG